MRDVGANDHRLAGAEALDLRFLEVRDHIHRLQRHHRHQRCAYAHELSQLHLPIADHAVDWRADCRALQIELGLLQLRLRRRDRRIGRRQSAASLARLNFNLLHARRRKQTALSKRAIAAHFRCGPGAVGLFRCARALCLRQRRARRRDLRLVVRGIDLDEHVAGMDALIFRHGDGAHIALHLRRDQRNVGAHIGVLSRHHVTADEEPIAAPNGDQDKSDGAAGDQQSAAPNRLSHGAHLSGRARGIEPKTGVVWHGKKLE